jgi:hypothetical protein
VGQGTSWSAESVCDKPSYPLLSFPHASTSPVLVMKQLNAPPAAMVIMTSLAKLSSITGVTSVVECSPDPGE